VWGFGRANLEGARGGVEPLNYETMQVVSLSKNGREYRIRLLASGMLEGQSKLRGPGSGEGSKAGKNIVYVVYGGQEVLVMPPLEIKKKKRERQYLRGIVLNLERPGVRSRGKEKGTHVGGTGRWGSNRGRRHSLNGVIHTKAIRW